MGPIIAIPDAAWVWWAIAEVCQSQRVRESSMKKAIMLIRKANPEWWSTVEAG